MNDRRAMVFTVPERGHVHPLLGPAAALERAGYEVVWGTSADIREDLRQAGARHVLVPDGAGPPAAALRGRGLAETIADPAALRGWIRALLVDAQRPLVPAYRAMLRDVRPDVVAIDTMVYAAAIAAQLEGIPWVGWSTSLNPVVPSTLRSELISTLHALDPLRHGLFEEHGLTARFAVSDVLSPRGTAVFTTKALVPSVDDDTVSLVGPSRGGIRGGTMPELPSDERPVVYVSFGSQAWYQPARFDRIIEAVQGLELTLVAAMGELAPSYRARRLAAAVHCEQYVDQPAVLERADVLITHGGANSVMESLAAGVPMLLAPLCNDQPHNRALVERSGSGRGLDLETASVPRIRAMLARLIAADGPERRAAKTIAHSYRAHDGAAGAAALAMRAAQ
ncbi:MAG: glycosyltransferase [Nannocystaceae bacterium]